MPAPQTMPGGGGCGAVVMTRLVAIPSLSAACVTKVGLPGGSTASQRGSFEVPSQERGGSDGSVGGFGLLLLVENRLVCAGHLTQAGC